MTIIDQPRVRREKSADLEAIAAALQATVPGIGLRIIDERGVALLDIQPDGFGDDGGDGGGTSNEYALVDHSSTALGTLTVVPPADTSPFQAEVIAAFVGHFVTALIKRSAHAPTLPLDATTLARVGSFSGVVHHPTDLAILTRWVNKVCGELIGSTGAAISMWDEERKLLKALPGAYDAPTPDVFAMGSPGTDLRILGARVFRTAQPYISNCAVGDPGILQSFVIHHGLNRLLSVPLLLGDKCVGALHLSNKHGEFTAEDLAAAESIAPWVASAVEIVGTVRRLRNQQWLDAVLSEAAQEIALATNSEAVLESAFTSFAQVMCASVISLIPKRGEPIVWRDETVPPVSEEGFFEDAAKRETISRVYYSEVVTDPGHATFHAPVYLMGEKAATISMLRKRGVPFAAYEINALSRLGSLAALVWLTQRTQRQRIDLMRLQERQRIADDLHDRVAQILFAAQLGLDSVLEHVAFGEQEAARLHEIRSLLTKGDTVIRDVIHELSPVRSSAVDRLKAVVVDVEEEFGTRVILNIADEIEELIEIARKPAIECLLKITREATVNALKHASATTVTVTVSSPDSEALVLSVVDDGRGIRFYSPAANHSYGISSMRRSAHDARGELTFEDGDGGHGTRVTAVVPI